MGQLQLLNQFLIHHIWDAGSHALTGWRARLVGALRIFYLILRDLLFDSQLTMQAMSLVYTTLLALVPLIAVSVSVLKGFGVHNQIEPVLLHFLEPLGNRGVEITKTIIGFVEKINSGLLGSLGLALLLYTVISLMQKIEQAFNHTWHVSEERSFAQRFSDYLSVILIGPVLVFAAIGITASISSTTIYQKMLDLPGLGLIVGAFSHVIPFLLVILAFTLIYIFIPNTRVALRSALVGASIAGVLWQCVGWLFTWFVTTANYSAIYSAFAAMFFFMIWLYASWTILLIGASIAYYFQNPEQRIRERRAWVLSNRMKEKLALSIMAEVARHFYQQTAARTLRALAQRLNIATESIHPIIQSLIQKGLLVRTDAEPADYVPGQAPETISLLAVIEAVRQAEEDEILNLKRLPKDAIVDHYYQIYQDAAAATLAVTTLKDLVMRHQDVAQHVTNK
jgi:membrane protein